MTTIHFEWDEQKRKANIRKHGFDFRDAPRIFQMPMLVALDDQHDYGEDRWIGIGVLNTRVVVIIFTEPAENIIRIISMMKATSYERNRYEQLLRDELG